MQMDITGLTPSVSYQRVFASQKHNFANYIDESGVCITLPYDLTLPFARYVAHNNVRKLKRYSFAPVYRRLGYASHPKSFVEADFDIVAPR